MDSDRKDFTASIWVTPETDSVAIRPEPDDLDDEGRETWDHSGDAYWGAF